MLQLSPYRVLCHDETTDLRVYRRVHPNHEEDLLQEVGGERMTPTSPVERHTVIFEVETSPIALNVSTDDAIATDKAIVMRLTMKELDILIDQLKQIREGAE